MIAVVQSRYPRQWKNVPDMEMVNVRHHANCVTEAAVWQRSVTAPSEAISGCLLACVSQYTIQYTDS